MMKNKIMIVFATFLVAVTQITVCERKNKATKFTKDSNKKIVTFKKRRLVDKRLKTVNYFLSEEYMNSTKLKKKSDENDENQNNDSLVSGNDLPKTPKRKDKVRCPGAPKLKTRINKKDKVSEKFMFKKIFLNSVED
ncbi:hypothetical protein KAH94_05585 [bacterium]|nr:hypothetical protein [bacterium]